MAMPENLILVRHGESEGNIAAGRSRRGDDSAFTEEFRNRHAAMWRLTDLGRKQAEISGDYIRSRIVPEFNNTPIFHRYYTSEYVRAMETAAFLGFENALWFAEFYLRERDLGKFEVMPMAERERAYADAVRERKIDSFYWVPPNGESLADLCLRIDRVLNTLHRECDGKNVIIVCHGDVMRAFRVRLERMSQERFREVYLSRNPIDQIHNGQIIQYSRCISTSSAEPYLNWMRSINPSDTSLSSNEWQKIIRPRYSNEDLRKRVQKVDQIVY
jgi:NAD+ kinase